MVSAMDTDRPGLTRLGKSWRWRNLNPLHRLSTVAAQQAASLRQPPCGRSGRGALEGIPWPDSALWQPAARGRAAWHALRRSFDRVF